MKTSVMVGLVVAVLLLAGGTAMADITIEMVPVGNTGNPGEFSGNGGGGYGEDRICGAVAYYYRIGKFEVTAGQYTAFLNAVSGVDRYGLYGTAMSNTNYGSGITRSGGGTVDDPYTYTVVTAFANRPLNYVSWGDAARFANWLTNGQPTGAQSPSTTEDGAYHLAGAVTDADLLAVVVPSAAQRATWSSGAKPYFLLPSEDEWYKAAYYNPTTGTYFDYATSSNTAPGRDMSDVSGNNANYYGSPFPIDSGKTTTVAGEFQLSDSPYGTFDQCGNVWEWNEAILCGSYRGLRGGGLFSNVAEITSRPGYYYYYDFYAPEGDTNIGFRVSKVPEPTTLALLALGGLAMIRRQRRS